MSYSSAMALSPEQEWTLVGCGLVAHADGIVEIGEWEQVLFMLDERLEDDDVDPWLALLSDREALQQHLATLAPPPTVLAESILEKSWRMALADGEGGDAEASVHDDLATRLGFDLPALRPLRAEWTRRSARRAELMAGFAAILALADGEVDGEERLRLSELLQRLPLSPERRLALEDQVDAPPTVTEVAGGLTALSQDDRRIALLGLAPLVPRRGAAERALFLELATAIAIAPADAERMLERSSR